MRLLFLPVLSVATLAAQTVSIEEYEPKSTLRVPEHALTRAKFPFIDVHNHQRDVGPEKLAQLLQDMDSLNMRILINSPVSGGQGKWVANAVQAMKGRDAARFAVMTNIDYAGLEDAGYPARAAAQVEADIKAGAIGLKVSAAEPARPAFTKADFESAMKDLSNWRRRCSNCRTCRTLTTGKCMS